MNQEQHISQICMNRLTFRGPDSQSDYVCGVVEILYRQELQYRKRRN